MDMSQNESIEAMNDLVHIQADRSYWYQRGEGQVSPAQVDLASLLARLAEESTHFQSDLMKALDDLGARPGVREDGQYYRYWQKRLGETQRISKTLLLFYPRMEDAAMEVFEKAIQEKEWSRPHLEMLRHQTFFMQETRKLLDKYTELAKGQAYGAGK